MPVLTCRAYAAGSATPPLIVSFEDACGRNVAATQVTAVVRDIYGTEQGTYVLNSGVVGPHVVQLAAPYGAAFELVDYPYVDAQGGMLSIQWTGDGISVWRLYTFYVAVQPDTRNVVLQWDSVQKASGYRVSFQHSGFDPVNAGDTIDVSGRQLLGYTSATTFTSRTPGGPNPAIRVADDAGGVWEVYVGTPLGALRTRSLGPGTAAPTYVLGDDGSSWELTVVSSNGSLLTTLSTEIAVVHYVSGPAKSWVIHTDASGVLLTDPDAVGGGACGVYIVDALSTCLTGGVPVELVTLSSEGFDISTYYTSKDICVLTGQVLSASGKPHTEHRVNVHAHHEESPQFVQSTLLLVNNEHSTALDDSGRFSLPVVQGSTVVVEIPGAHFSRKVFIPQQPQADLSGLSGIDIELRRGE